MSELFLKLVNLSITASWLVLAAVILRLVLKKAPKFIHCIMWALVGIRLVFPFSIESVLSLAPSTNTFPVENIYSANTDIANNSYYHGVDSGVEIIDNALRPLTSDVSNPEVLRSNLDIISIVWIAGIFAMLAYTIISYLRILKRVRASIAVKENTFICDDIDTPFILGIFRPRIYLPSSMSEADAEYVIAHEKAHLKRLDHLWKPLGFLILSVYWFNPVLWLGYFLLCRDIEFACDEKVIGELGADIKKPYSDALINCSVPRKMLAACPLAFGETSVKSRIKSVLSFKKPAVWVIIASILAVSIAAVCLLTSPQKDAKVTSGFYQSDKAEEFGEFSTIGITLSSDNTCEISFSMTGDFFYGSYKIDDNILVCSLDKLQGEYIKQAKINIEYHFEILEDDRLEFENVVGKVGKYYSTIDNSEYVFEEQLSHFAKGDTFTLLRTANGENEDTSSGISGGEENVNASFNATVLEVHENYLLVQPLENQNVSTLSIEVSKNVISQIPVPDLKVGNKVTVVYNGEIMETYPKQINKVFAIYLIGAGSEDVVYKLSYANYTSDSTVYTAALNTSKMYQSSQKHLPIYKFESRNDIEQFKKLVGGSLAIDAAYNNIQSFNDATAEYGAEFFKDNALILAYISSNSCSWRYGVKEIYNDGKNFQLIIVRSDSNETGDSAMCGWYVTTEVKKSDIKNCTSFDAVCNDINSGISIPHSETSSQQNGSQLSISLSGIEKIAVKSKYYPEYAREITSAETIDKLIAMFKELETSTEHKHPMNQTGGDTVVFSLFYQGGKTQTIEVFADRYVKLNDQNWFYIDEGNFPAILRLALDIPRITPAENYSEIVDKNITAIYVLENFEGTSADALYSLTKTYTDQNLIKLKSYLNTNYCEYKDVGQWVKWVAGMPEKYAVALTLEDNSTRIITIHYDEYSTTYYFAIGKSNKPFEAGDKDTDYLREYSYDRYVASAQFGDYLFSLL